MTPLSGWDPKVVFGLLLLLWLGGAMFFFVIADLAQKVAYELETRRHRNG